MLKPAVPGAPVYITRKEGAQIRRCTPQYLALLDMRGEGPPSYKPGGGRSGHVLYRLDEFLSWIESGKTETADEAA